MSPFRLACIIAAPCITSFFVGVADIGTAEMTVAMVVVLLAVIALAFITSCSIEWAKQDAVRVATGTLLDEINERNVERAAMQRRIESLKRNLTRPRGEEE